MYTGGTFSSEGTEGPEGDWWYCADTCEPGRCDIGEVCELWPTPCAGPFRPCPPVAVCQEICLGECEEDQVRGGVHGYGGRASLDWLLAPQSLQGVSGRVSAS